MKLRPGGIDVVVGHGMSNVAGEDAGGRRMGDYDEVGVNEMMVAREVIEYCGI